MLSNDDPIELKAMISLLDNCCDFCQYHKEKCQMKVLENHGSDCFFFQRKENNYSKHIR